MMARTTTVDTEDEGMTFETGPIGSERGVRIDGLLSEALVRR
jgi:hypothetical protein